MELQRKYFASWREIGERIDRKLPFSQDGCVLRLYGVPRGGRHVVGLACVRDPEFYEEVRTPEEADVIVDDIIDSGATAERYTTRCPDKPFVALYSKDEGLGWIVFPWETIVGEEHGPADAVTRLLQFIGEDVTRDGLRDTPERVVKAYAELTAGYGMDPKAILSRTFAGKTDEMVLLRGIRFASLCEHHLMPFTGLASVAYIPGDFVVGISKLSRLVECFARRLQIQERMTEQIADAIMECLAPRGCAVVLEAHHACMGCRGVMQPDAEMVTSALRGAFLDQPATRAEFYAQLRRGR